MLFERSIYLECQLRIIHVREVWLSLAEWYRRSCHLKQFVDDRRRTLAYLNSSLPLSLSLASERALKQHCFQ